MKYSPWQIYKMLQQAETKEEMIEILKRTRPKEEE